MSEPVGNTPRSVTPANIPSNSHKNRGTEALPETDERELVEKVVAGKVISRKPPWWKRAMGSMVADDAQNVGDFILTDVIVPATKNLIADIVGQGINRVLYGTSRTRRPSGLGGLGSLDNRGSLRTQYNKMSDEPVRRISNVGRARHDFNEIVLESREDAIFTINGLIHRIERYGSASVADLYNLVGTTGSFADQRWGWTDLNHADVRQVRGGFLLDLPHPDPLR